jgi:Uma2 family endonuclease
MASVPTKLLSSKEYLAIERAAEAKSEYYDGEMILMAGASRQHNLIVANIVRALGNKLERRPFEVYPSIMRVKVPDARRYFYPEASVACGDLQFEDKEVDTLLNPILIVEVFSESTESYDRVRKFDNYRKIPSLKEYLLISQYEYKAMLYTRQADGKWSLMEATDPDAVLKLSSVNCKLTLSELYNKVKINKSKLLKSVK